MKNSTLFILLSICVLASSCGDNSKKTSLEEEGLRGKVRSVYSMSYKGVDKFGEGHIVKGDPEYFGSYYQTFDSTGFVTTKKEFFISNSKKKYENTYDMNGRNIKWTSYDDNGKLKYSDEYEYDEHGNKSLDRDLVDHDVTRIKNTYDSEGRLTQVVRGYETTTYQYNEKGQLIKETDRYPYLGTSVDEYKYDDEGRMIQRNYKGYSGSKSYYFFKYDSFNRRIAFIKCNSDDPDNGKVLAKHALYYADNYATEPYMTKEWDEDGKLVETKYNLYFAAQKDTLSYIQLDDNYCPTSISVYSKKGQNHLSTSYDVKSSLFIGSTYNYIDGKLASCVDEDGHLTSYQYDRNTLTSVVRELSKGKIVSNYKNGRVISTTVYDSHNKPETTRTYEYNGKPDNGSVTCTYTDKDKKTDVVTTTRKDGRILEEVVVKNGLTITSKYSYNDEGYVSQIISSDGKTKTYSYLYDSFGNWLQRTEKAGDAITIVERKIDYYL